MVAEDRARYVPEGPVDIVERAHPDLGRLGVFWHTQGSGKSYSMAFFAEKVRRKLDGNFTFLLMTDRNDLDSQIYGTFVGTGSRRQEDPAGGIGRRSAAAAEGEPPLRLQPDPQVQQGCRPEPPLQRTRRHHRDLRRGAPHAGRAAGPKHALCTAQRGVHRIHRDAALPARRTHQTHLRRLRIAVRLQAVRGGRRDGQAGLREPRRQIGGGAVGPERAHRGQDRRRGPRSGSGGAARQAARQGLRGANGRRAARAHR